MILSRILKEHDYWLRLATLIHYFKEALYNSILHRSCKLPLDPKKLYKVLNKKRKKIDNLLKRHKISEEQYNLIFPSSHKTQIKNFDIGTFVLVVRNCTSLKPSGGWTLVRNLKRGDRGKAALLLELEEHIHENMEGIEPILLPRFLEDWDDLVYLFKGLKMNVKDIRDLKACDMNNIPVKYIEAVMKAQIEFVRNNQKLHTYKIRSLQLDDEDDANRVDIANLINQNTKIEKLVNSLYDSIAEFNASWNDVYNSLIEIDELLIALTENIDFLNQLMIMDRQPVSHNNDNDSEQTEVHLEERLKLGMRKLKAAHAFSLSKNDHSTDNENLLQPFAKLDLISRSKSSELSKEENVDIEDIFKYNSHIIVRGISGIGKTYMVRHIIEKWMHGCMFEDIKFLFVLYYKDVKNTACESLEELLNYLYPHVFEDISLGDILSKTNQMLIIFDGWGQVSRLDYRHKHNRVSTYVDFELSRWFFEAIDLDHGILLAQRTIITAHPDFYSILTESLANTDVTVIDILGFKKEDVYNYILNFLKDEKELLDIVIQKVDDCESLQSLLQIPINLWVFCMIHYLDHTFDDIKTRTELYLWKSAILLNEMRADKTVEYSEAETINLSNEEESVVNKTKHHVTNHISDINEVNKTKHRITNHISDVNKTKHHITNHISDVNKIEHSVANQTCSEDISESIVSMCASNATTDQQCSFSEKEQEIDLHLFDDGIVASSIYEAAQLSYEEQIKGYADSANLHDHTMQEFFTSVYLYIMNTSPLEIKQDDRLRACLPFVAGLHGISVMSYLSVPCLKSSFVKNLNALHNQDFINQLFLTYIHPSKRLKECTLKEEFLSFLASYFEFQNPLVRNEEFKNIKINIDLLNLLPSDVDNLIYFLDREHYQLDIISLNIHTHKAITKKQMENLAPHLLQIPTIKIDIKAISESSDVLSKILSTYKGRKEFEIKIAELHLMQACEYNFAIDVNLNWLAHVKKFHLCLNLTNAPLFLNNLKYIIPRTLNAHNGFIKLKSLKLTIQNSSVDLFPTISMLLNSLIYLKEIEIVISKKVNKEINDGSRPYRKHKPVKKDANATDASAIKYALYQALNDNTMPKNLRRLVIRDRYCNYEFIINRKQQVTFVFDGDGREFIDVDIMNF